MATLTHLARALDGVGSGFRNRNDQLNQIEDNKKQQEFNNNLNLQRNQQNQMRLEELRAKEQSSILKEVAKTELARDKFNAEVEERKNEIDREKEILEHREVIENTAALEKVMDDYEKLWKNFQDPTNLSDLPGLSAIRDKYLADQDVIVDLNRRLSGLSPIPFQIEVRNGQPRIIDKGSGEEMGIANVAFLVQEIEKAAAQAEKRLRIMLGADFEKDRLEIERKKADLRFKKAQTDKLLSPQQARPRNIRFIGADGKVKEVTGVVDQDENGELTIRTPKFNELTTPPTPPQVNASPEDIKAAINEEIRNLFQKE